MRQIKTAFPMRILVLTLLGVIASYPAQADRIFQYTYNTQGRVETVDGPRTGVSDVTTYAYDANGNLTHITNALGHQTQIPLHDGAGRPLALIDTNGVATTLGYDSRGRLLILTTLGNVTSFTYDLVGNLTHVTKPNGAVLEYIYDVSNRLIAIKDSMGNRIDYTLDAMGNQTLEQVKDPTGTLKRSHSQVFDELGRMIRSITAGGQVTAYGYDANGNQLSVTDPQQRLSTNSYDALNRLVQVTDAGNGITQYGYDEQDNLVSVTDPKGGVTTYTYSGLGDLLSQTSPDTGTTTYTYDEAGNRSSQTDARGVTTHFTYDALNRLTQIIYPDASLNVTYTYDQGAYGVGRLTAMQDASGQTEYMYDGRGNLVQAQAQIGSDSYRLGYAYDDAGNLVRITYPSGRVVDYTYDMANRVIRVTATQDGQSQTLAENVNYLPFGPLSALTYGNGIIRNLTFDQDYRLTQLTDGADLDRAYTYDVSDNITAIADNILTTRDQDFSYDSLDRLIQAAGAYGQLDYTYDGVGNRLSFTQNRDGQLTGDGYSYEVDSNRLTAIIGDHPASFQYDGNGNITESKGSTYFYDNRNRLAQVETSSQTITYVYNGKGERTEKHDGTHITQYLYDSAGRLLMEHLQPLNEQREYAYLNGQRLAVWVNDDSQSGTVPATLTSGQTTNASVGLGAWQYFQIVTTANDTNLSVILDNLSADADLYVRAGWKPDASTYDCRVSMRGTLSETCNLESTGVTIWYVAVFGYEASDYSLTATLSQGGSDRSPPTVPQNLVGTAISHEQIDLNWSAAVDNGGGNIGYNVYRNGESAPVATVTGTSYSDTGLWWDTTYSYQVTAFDDAIPANESSPSMPSVSVTTQQYPVIALRINAGGAEYTDSGGNIWSADTGFNTGRIAFTSDDIADTIDDPLYQVIRWDDGSDPELQYRFQVPAGSYTVNLHFNETWSGAFGPGLRVFDVLMEDGLVLDDVDIYSQTGGGATALVLSVPVRVADGELNIEFIHQVDNPSISAIEVLEQASVPGDISPPTVPQDLVGTAISPNQIDLNWTSSIEQGGNLLLGYKVYRDGASEPIAIVTGSSYSDTGVEANTTYSYQVTAFDNAVPMNESTPSVPPLNITTPPMPVSILRINAGGGEYTDSNGNIWSADTGFNTGRIAYMNGDIADTIDDPLYQVIRWDDGSDPELQYRFEVPTGSYTVKLHFNETWSGAFGPGLRVFDVMMEDEQVLDDVDIYSQAGGGGTALELSVPVNVTDGELNIEFIHQVDNPCVSAIEVLQ
jgi:YD repeat-containing protein